ncbi:MAG: hypothetical protein LKG11_00805 [Bacilli bacterium]|nr:hypothetical protein [Bacilli bacterium]
MKKPIPVEAVRVEKENREEIISMLSRGSTKWEEMQNGFVVHSWEGIEPTLYGSDYYIIKGIKGECYPCDGKVFRDSYTEFYSDL